ncbi:MAG: signal peptidase II [Lachnospiraceae bacterium]|nr:signal peptidase II [Lachnospiraceae bacterium]
MNRNVLKYILFVLISGLLIFVDQLTKRLALKHLCNKEPIVLINNVLELVYVENRGAAFGILQNKYILFYLLTALVLVIILFNLYKLDLTSKYIPYFAFLVLIFSGAVGNFIDRLKNKYVIDFIYFKPIDFPVFNFADICITIGCAILIFSFIFIYKGDDI